jgi:holo-[acyl-carrier protein] synthase
LIKGIGTDIVELVRIQKIGVDRLSKRILTENEQLQLPETEKRRLEFVAGRFAAKEAISKALGTGLGAFFSFSDVEILADEKGAPKVYWTKEVSNLFVHLSISHSDQYAVAMVVMEEE